MQNVEKYCKNIVELQKASLFVDVEFFGEMLLQNVEILLKKLEMQIIKAIVDVDFSYFHLQIMIF